MANEKNAPEAFYFKRHGYSQTYPFVLVSKSASGKTATLKMVRTKKDPEWKPVMHPGGFCAHCSNQEEQTWLYDGVSEGEIKVRKNKHGIWVNHGDKYTEDYSGPTYYYDYNF